MTGSARNDTILASTLAFMGGALLVAAMRLDWLGLEWTETDAAWVQAFGTVTAMGVAITVPTIIRWHDKRAEQNERRLKARSLAISLRSDIGLIRDLAAITATRVRARKRAYPDTSISRLPIPPEFGIPDGLRSQMNNLPILGEVICVPLQQALQIVGRINRLRILDASLTLTQTGKVLFAGEIADMLDELATKLMEVEMLLDNFDLNWR